jgi:hypothetical protein
MQSSKYMFSSSLFDPSVGIAGGAPPVKLCNHHFLFLGNVRSSLFSNLKQLQESVNN